VEKEILQFWPQKATVLREKQVKTPFFTGKLKLLLFWALVFNFLFSLTHHFPPVSLCLTGHLLVPITTENLLIQPARPDRHVS
jgi:hypothetical protein